ncbi:MAG: flippase-like domain-containing protein [Chloroflexi bacterium]|nr:flippase-like domain-containing protein [Chloroflexota bacterium]
MKKARFWIGIVISVLCLYLATRGIDFATVLSALRQVNLWWLLPVPLLLLASLVARAYRWQVLFYPLQGLHFGRLLNVINIGYLVSNIFPFRAGDLVRSYLIAELEKVNVGRALSTVIVDRVMDTLTIVAFLAALIPFVPLSPALMQSGRVVSVVAIGVILVLMVLSWQKERAMALVSAVLRRTPLNKPSIYEFIASGLDGLAVLRSPRQGPGLIASSLLIWALLALMMYCGTLAFGLSVPFAAGVAVIVFTSLGMTVPSSPGYIGVFEALTVVALGLFGVEEGVALTYALVMHALNYVLFAIFGLFGAWKESISYEQLREKVAEAG